MKTKNNAHRETQLAQFVSYLHSVKDSTEIIGGMILNGTMRAIVQTGEEYLEKERQEQEERTNKTQEK